MAQLSITRNYQDGTLLTEAHLDAAFDSIETFINITKLASDNIQAGGILTSNIASGAITKTLLESSVANSLVPVGTILPYGGTTAPTGFLICDGAEYSHAAGSPYLNLYNVIQYSFGGDSTNQKFRVPDLRGVFLRGLDGSAGRDPDSASRTALYANGNTGNNIGSYQSDEFKSHNHSLTMDPHRHQIGDLVQGSGSNNTGIQTSENLFPSPYNGNDPIDYTLPVTTTGTIGNSGGNETRPKNVYVNFIIKY